MPETIKIDIWGQIEGENDNYRIKPPARVDIDAPALGDGYTFERFFDECPCAIQRTHNVTQGGRVIVRKDVAYNDWEIRSSLADSDFYPINSSPISVYRQEIFYSGGTQSLAAVAGVEYSYVLTGGTMRYGATPPTFMPGSYHYDGDESYQAIISSDGTISGTFRNAGTYNITAFLVAPKAKPVPIPIVITVTNS